MRARRRRSGQFVNQLKSVREGEYSGIRRSGLTRGIEVASGRKEDGKLERDGVHRERR